MYAKPENHLTQGDIFDLRVLGVFASHENHVLRDGSQLPLNNPNGQITDGRYHLFSNMALPLHGVETILCRVVTLRRFVVVSQTCDVSGVDSPPSNRCLVAPVIAIGGFIRDFKLPLPQAELENAPKLPPVEVLTFLKSKLPARESAIIEEYLADDFRLPDALRNVLQAWRPNGDSVEGRLKKQLRDFLNNIAQGKSGKTYYLPRNDARGIPESFIDFLELHLVQTSEVASKREKRLATIASPAREDFSQKLGQVFMRVALATPARGASF